MVILPFSHKQAYLERYALPDKVHTPLSREEHWPAPYWDIDTGFGVMLILLTAVDLGLGALFFGIFQGERPSWTPWACRRGIDPSAPSPRATRRRASAPVPELPTGRRRLDEVVRWEHW